MIKFTKNQNFDQKKLWNFFSWQTKVDQSTDRWSPFSGDIFRINLEETTFNLLDSKVAGHHSPVWTCVAAYILSSDSHEGSTGSSAAKKIFLLCTVNWRKISTTYSCLSAKRVLRLETYNFSTLWHRCWINGAIVLRSDSHPTSKFRCSLQSQKGLPLFVPVFSPH